MNKNNIPIEQWVNLFLPLIKFGKSLLRIAKQYGFSRSWISKVKSYLQTWGKLLPYPTVEQKPARRLTDQEEYVLRSIGRYGLRPSDIARAMGISPSRISNIIRNLKAMRYLTPAHGACRITKQGGRELVYYSEFGSYQNLKQRGFKNG
jgi:transcriptional regulator with XRE-family HTH domain